MTKQLRRSGIYFLYSKRKKLVYIGKSVDLRSRLANHHNTFDTFKSRAKRGLRSITDQTKPFEYFRYCFVSQLYLEFYEDYFIDLCKPIYNGMGINIPDKFDEARMKALAKYS